MHHGLAMQRDAGQAALATGDGQQASKVVPVPALCSEAGPTTGAAQEIWGGLVDVAGEKTSKSSWETPWAAPQAEHVPSAGTAAPGVLRSRVALPPSLPACFFQHPCQHLKADFSSCHQSVTGCGWPWHLDPCAMQDMASWLPLCQGALSDGEGMSDLLAEFGGFLSC